LQSIDGKPFLLVLHGCYAFLKIRPLLLLASQKTWSEETKKIKDKPSLSSERLGIILRFRPSHGTSAQIYSSQLLHRS
jgi:hypothetical protein